MKKLYVVDNQQDYSGHCFWLVVADPDEWDDLEGVLTLGEREQTIEAVCSEWRLIGEACAHPADTLRVTDNLFTWVDSREEDLVYESTTSPPPPRPHRYWKDIGYSGHHRFSWYKVANGRVSRRDAGNILVELRARAEMLGTNRHDAEELKILEEAFAAGEFA